jgi:hypothetical protein
MNPYPKNQGVGSSNPLSRQILKHLSELSLGAMQGRVKPNPTLCADAWDGDSDAPVAKAIICDHCVGKRMLEISRYRHRLATPHYHLLQVAP